MIATTLNHNIPFVISDILISSPEGKDDVQLPTNDFPINLHLSRHIANKPHELRQKLYIIQSNICVAIVGNLAELIPFIKEFRTQCKYYSRFGERKVTKDDIASFLQGYGLDEKMKKSGFLISHVGYDENGNPESWNQFTRGPWDYVQNDVFEEALACGSGRDEFFNHVNQSVGVQSSHGKGDINFALQMNILFISRLLTIERVTLSNLSSAWGAGYELAMFTGTEFKKLESIGYVVMHGEFDSSGEIGIPEPKLVLYYKYVNDILYITAIELYDVMKTVNDKEIIFRSQRTMVNIYVVVSVEHTDEDPPIEILNDFSFNTNAVAMGYAIITPSNGVYNPAFYTVSKDVSVNFVQDKFVEVRLHADLNNMVRSGAKSAYPNILKETKAN